MSDTPQYQTLVVKHFNDRMQPPVKGFNMEVAGCEVVAMDLRHSLDVLHKLEEQVESLKTAGAVMAQELQDQADDEKKVSTRFAFEEMVDNWEQAYKGVINNV